ncbi:MAG: hypothetical protein ACPGJV_14445 [Bacteriovoracaceae bacterium]
MSLENQEPIILILVLFVVIIISAVIFLFLKLKKLEKQQDSSDVNKDDALQKCKNHPDEWSKGICAICGDSFCESCLIEHDQLNFCRDHFKIYLENQWVTLEKVQTSAETAEESMYLYDFKSRIWNKESLPLIVVTHYQIDVEGDHIESQVQLLVPDQHENELKPRLEEYKIKH